MRSTPYLYQLPKLRMSGAIPLLSLCNFIARTGTALYFLTFLWINLERQRVNMHDTIL